MSMSTVPSSRSNRRRWRVCLLALVVGLITVVPEEWWEMVKELKTRTPALPKRYDRNATASSPRRDPSLPDGTLALSNNRKPVSSQLESDQTASQINQSEAVSFTSQDEQTDNNIQGGGQGQIRLCTREELIDGRWTEISLPQAPYKPISDEANKVSSCYSKADFSPDRPWLTYDWQTQNASQCRFVPWSRDKFCELGTRIAEKKTSGRNVTANTTISPPGRTTLAVVGDSLSFEHFSSLIMLLGLDSNEQDQMKTYYNKTLFHSQRACNDTWNLVYKRGDYLETLPEVMEKFAPNIVVINRGAHYTPDETMLPQLKVTLKHLKQWQSNCTDGICWVIFRTTVPGHPNCSSFTEPVNDLETMERWVTNMSLYDDSMLYKPLFHWWDLQRQNQLMLEALSGSGIDYQIMDAYYLNIRRPDRHRGQDCLHSCYPGKMDVYNQLLLHLLTDKLE